MVHGPRSSDGLLRLGLGLVFALALGGASAAVSASARTTSSLTVSSHTSHSQAGSAESSRQLSAKTRREVFERAWKEIEVHYYDRSFNGVDWNEVHARYKPLVEAVKDDHEFYSLMSRMTGELHDAHTRFNSPEQWRNVKKQQGVGSGLSLDEIDGKIVVTSIRRGFERGARGD